MRSLSSNSLAPPVSSLPSVLPISPHPQLLPTPQARPKPAEAPWCSIPKDLPVLATSAPLILMLASSIFEPKAGGGGDEREKEGPCLLSFPSLVFLCVLLNIPEISCH